MISDYPLNLSEIFRQYENVQTSASHAIFDLRNPVKIDMVEKRRHSSEIKKII